MSKHVEVVRNLIAAIKSGNASIVGFDPEAIKSLEALFEVASIPNVLEQRFNPSGWQWEEKGKPSQLEDLSRDDLIQVACSEMEVLERMDSMIGDMKNLMSQWRNGEVEPENDYAAADSILSI